MSTNSQVIAVAADPPLDIGSRRELFVEQYLIDRLECSRMELAPAPGDSDNTCEPARAVPPIPTDPRL
jgi:hypothetical protein